MSSELDRLETLLPLVDSSRRQWLEQRIRELRQQREIPASWLEGPVGASGVAGTGMLDFQAGSPGGSGRLVCVPFFLQAANPYVIVDAGINSIPLAHPSMVLQVPTGTGLRSIGPLDFSTRNVPWARLRVVGFQVSKRYGLGVAECSYTAPWVLAKDLRVEGGVTLLSNEAYIDTTPYSNLLPQYGGLRDYPLLEPDNVASVRVSVLVGQTGGAGIDDMVRGSLALWLVCEVLEDDFMGSYEPGPYARAGALRRHQGDRTTDMITR